MTIWLSENENENENERVNDNMVTSIVLNDEW